MFIKKLKNQTGLGLVEVMVAASILGGLSLVVMKLNESGTQGVSRVEKGMEIVEFDAEINNYLSTPEGCTQSLGAAPLPLLTAFDSNIEKSYLPSIKDRNGDVRFSPNEKRRNVTFKEAYLTAYGVASGSPTYGPGPGNAFLFKVFEFPISPGKTMTKTKVSTVSITPDTLNTRISSCVIRATKSDSVWSIDTHGISYSSPETVAIGKSANNDIPHALDIEGQVVMGLGNTVTGSNVGGASIFGGYRNILSGSTGSYSSINGGDNNSISNARSATINGGSYNVINTSGNYGAIVGGYTNTVSAQAGAVVGGEFNYVSGSNAASVGGQRNTVSSSTSTVLGGDQNQISASSVNSSIVGGQQNLQQGTGNSSIIGGANNLNLANHSAIVGGSGNQLLGTTSSSSGIGHLTFCF